MSSKRAVDCYAIPKHSFFIFLDFSIEDMFWGVPIDIIFRRSIQTEVEIFSIRSISAIYIFKV